MCKRTSLFLPIGLAVFLSVSSASGVEIPVPDAGFDDHVLSDPGDIYISDSAYTGSWKTDGSAWVDRNYWLSEGYPEDLQAVSPNNKAYCNWESTGDVIYQVLDENFIAGVTYTLSIWAGQPWDGYDRGWRLFFTGEDYQDNLAETSGSAPASWEQVNLVYTATAADAGRKIGIKMSSDEYVAFDSVTLSFDEPVAAFSPNPGQKQTDVRRDAVLGWKPGKFAASTNGHVVYFGESFDEVTNATGGTAQTGTTYAPGVLTYGQTYYWRVDDLDTANTVYTGDVWSFTVEPVGIPVENITATASASSPGMEATRTIDGSGLNELDQHSAAAMDMWFSGPSAGPVWIQYEFDQAYKLHELLVWNANQIIESLVGFGAKEVLIETSLDGDTWTALEDAPEFAQATGSDDYTANTSVGFGNAMVKYVKLTMVSGYGITGQFGLSEVRFLHIPTFAREPQPDDGAVDVPLDALLSWRAGREAASHEVYLGTDPDSLALAATTQENSYEPADLNYDSTYFWQVVEVNDAEDPASYVGPVWSFTTTGYGVVDNFDQYDDDCQRIFFVWLDGLGHNGSETCVVAPYNGNGTGSIVGNATAPFADRTVVRSGSVQSMPLAYDNSAATSEIVVATDDLAIGRDWTMGSPTTMTLWFFGDPNNADAQLYVEIGNTRIEYPGDTDALRTPDWNQWDIDLAGINLGNVPTLAIGLDRIGAGAGIVYIDDILLFGEAPETTANELLNGGFEHWGDHPDAGNWAYVTTIQDEPGVAWYVHDTDDASTGAWFQDRYSGYQHIVGTNGDRTAVISEGDTSATVSQDLGETFVAGETYTFSIDIFGDGAGGEHWAIGIGTAGMSNRNALERQRGALALAASNAQVRANYFGNPNDYTVLDPPDVFSEWQTRTVSYIATAADAGKEITVFFSGGFADVGTDEDTCFDNARLVIGPLE